MTIPLAKRLRAGIPAKSVGAFSHGWTLFRHAITMSLLTSAFAVAWQLVSPLLHRADVRQQPVLATEFQAQHTAMQSVMEIEQAHLFGQATVTGNIGGPVVSVESLSVEGILYADDANDSVAMLSANGQTLLVRVGTDLPTGGKVTAISPDSVEVTGPDGISDLPLDIRQADTGQRIASLRLDGASQAEAAIAGSEPPQLPVQSPGEPAVHVTLMPTHFQSLGALRGRKTPDHFGAIKPP
jgi:hypothetical protein